MSRRRKRGRKLLVASVGVAAVSYACGSTSEDGGSTKDASQDTNQFDQVANLVAPDSGEEDVSTLDVVANLVAPDAAEDNSIPLDVVANLVAPDSGLD